MVNPEDTLRNECWNKNFHALAFEFMFNERAKSYSWKSNWLKVFGILVPAFIASTIISYDNFPKFKAALLTLLTVVTLFQFGLSILAIIYKWDDELSYSYEASQSYNNIQRRYKSLAQLPHINYADMLNKYNLLEVESNSRNQQDSKHNIENWEKRQAMRYALREKHKECIGCKITPLSLSSTDCDVCGKFSFKYKYF